MMLSLMIKIKDFHHCKETNHAYAIVRTSHKKPTWSIRATWFPWAPCWVGDPWFRFNKTLASVVQPWALLSCVSVMLQGKKVYKSEGLLADL